MPFVRFAVLSTIALLLTCVPFASAHGQSLTTASKSAEISAFGGYVASQPDYGPFIKTGFGAGVDLTIFPRFPVAPSFEVRAHEVSGPYLIQRSLMAGLRVQRDIRNRFHPYADFLIGVGQIEYKPIPNPDYTADQSKAYSIGGGINIDLAYHLAAKFDYQQQEWNLGPNAQNKPQGGDYTLSPTTMLVGVTYTVPFRKLNRHGDFR
jgi:opacity protein-like surface antigen